MVNTTFPFRQTQHPGKSSGHELTGGHTPLESRFFPRVVMKIYSIVLLVCSLVASNALAQDFWVPVGPIGNPDLLPSPQPVYGQVSNILFGYTGNSGIYRSDDHGQSWYTVSTAVQGIRNIVESKQKKLFAVCSEDLVLVSTDAGIVWDTVAPLTGQFVNNIFVSPKGFLYATIMMGGIWRSTDDGITWEQKNVGVPDQHWGEGVAFLSNGDILLSTGASGVYGIFRSTNDGDSWVPSQEGLTHTYTYWLCEGKPGIVFAGTNSTGLYRSTDNGKTWHISVKGIADSTKSEVFHVFADGAGILYADCSYRAGLYRSTDDGLTWQSIQSGLKYKSPGNIVIDNEGYMYYGGRDRIYRAAEKVTPPKAGVEEIVLPAINIYPNPAEEYVVINSSGAARVEIYDQIGRIVVREQTKDEATTIPISHLPKGTYTIRADGAANVRFIKQ